MRILIFTLLAANLIFFAWARWVDVPALSVAAANVPALQLAPGGNSPPPVSVCRRLGPFADDASLLRAGTDLAALQFTASPVPVESQKPMQYALYIGGMSSESDQRRIMGELRRAGITDATALAAESGARRISVGLFNEQSGAEARAAQVRDAGLRPETEVRYQPVTEMWLKVEAPLGAELPPPERLAGAPVEAAWQDCYTDAPSAESLGEAGIAQR